MGGYSIPDSAKDAVPGALLPAVERDGDVIVVLGKRAAKRYTSERDAARIKERNADGLKQKRELEAASRQRRYENCTVDIQIDANGWPHILIFPKGGKPLSLHCRPNGHAEFIEDRSNEDKIW